MSAISPMSVPGFKNHTGLSIVRADTEALQHTVYAFRYQIYVEDMQRRQKHADHARRIIREPLDERGENYLAIKDGMIVGTVRRNRMNDPAAAYHEKLFRSHLFGEERQARIAMTTKLMVRPDLQGGTVAPRLLAGFASDDFRTGVEIDLIDCNKHLVPFMERLGFLSYRGWAFHNEFGTVRPMFLPTDALSYMREIRSILWPAARPHTRMANTAATTRSGASRRSLGPQSCATSHMPIAGRSRNARWRLRDRHENPLSLRQHVWLDAARH